MAKITLKKIILLAILAVGLIFTLIAPAFSVMSQEVYGIKLLEYTGFEFMTHSYEGAEMMDTMAFKGIQFLPMIVGWAMLVIAIVYLIIGIVSFFKKDEDAFAKNGLTALIVSTVFAVIYAVSGFVTKMVFEKNANGGKAIEGLSTNLFIPAIIIAVMLVGYIVVKAVIKTKDAE